MAIQEIDPQTASQWLSAGEAALIDVREADEHARERIRGAGLIPLSRFDPAAIPATGRVILHCRSGQRSMDAAQRLAATGRAEVYSLRGGIDAWRQAGLPVDLDRKAPLPIMRQVQIVAGSAVLLGSILALVSPWFLLLTGFFGAGLLFAGVSGWCGMARMLGAMPWNRASA